MPPVDATATCSGPIPNARAAASCVWTAASMPAAPVAALAQPELATIARSARRLHRSWQTSTGAAAAPERVDTAEVRLPNLTNPWRIGRELDERLGRVGIGEQLRQLVGRNRSRGSHVAAGQFSLVERHEMWCELDGEVRAEERELLLDLG